LSTNQKKPSKIITTLKEKPFKKKTGYTKIALKRLSQGFCIKCASKPHLPKGVFCFTCREDNNEKSRLKYENIKHKLKEFRANNRLVVLNYYGGKCVCCGETTNKFLAMDHIHGGGTKHRKTEMKCSNIYDWCIKNNFPTSMQILCHNCNVGRHLNGGICPHKE